MIDPLLVLLRKPVALAVHFGNTKMPHCLFYTGLGKQDTYSSTGYSLNIVWQPDYATYWNSLGCLDSLVSLSINGTLPNLPAAWAENSSFPLLQVQCVWL